MSKPRLAEILGVEVDEVFTIKGETGREYSVDSCGVFYINGACKSGDIYDLMYIIDNPEIIVRKPKSRWTKQDVEDAKAVKRLFPNAESVYKNGVGRLHLGYKDDKGPERLFNELDSSCFRGLQRCTKESLDDIINSEVADNE